MVSVDEAVIARLERAGEKFEILIDPQIAEKIKNNEGVNILEALAIDSVFKDSKKGLKASEEKLNEVFGTNAVEEIAKKIILTGDIQLTTDQRRKMTDDKKRQIITIISRNAINPQTHSPHPPQRIEMAMNEAKVHIDPFKSADAQAKAILDKLRPLIPIRFEKIKIAVKVTGEDYGKVYGDIKRFGDIMQEDWQKDGTWICIVEIPAGLSSEFYERLNDRTKGNIETKVIK